MANHLCAPKKPFFPSRDAIDEYATITKTAAAALSQVYLSAFKNKIYGTKQNIISKTKKLF